MSVILRRPPPLRHPLRFLRYHWDGLRAYLLASSVRWKPRDVGGGWTVARVLNTNEGRDLVPELWLCRPGKPRYPYFSAWDTPDGRRKFLYMVERCKKDQNDG